MLEETNSIKDEMNLQKKLCHCTNQKTGMAQNNIAQKLVKDQENHEEMWELFSVMALTEIPEVEEVVIGYYG